MTGHQPHAPVPLTDTEHAAWVASGMPTWATPYAVLFREEGITPDQAAPYWTTPHGYRLLEPVWIRDYLTHRIPAETVHRLQHAGVLHGDDILNLARRGCPVGFAEHWLGERLTEDNATTIGVTFARRYTTVIDTLGCPPTWATAFWSRFTAHDPQLRGFAYDLLRDWWQHHPRADPARAALYADAGITVHEYRTQPHQFAACTADELETLAALRRHPAPTR